MTFLSVRAVRRAVSVILLAIAAIGHAPATPADPFDQILDFLIGQSVDPGLDPNGDGRLDVADLVWLLNNAGPTEAAGVVLTVCEDQVPILRFATIHVDVVDAQGRIINPGMPGGLPEDQSVLVTLNASGAGVFDGLFNFTFALISEPGGADVDLLSMMPETVTVTGTADPLPAPTPVDVEFIAAGSISGTLLIDDGSPRPPLLEESFTIIAEQQGGGFGGLGTYDPAGNYTIPGLPPGTYTVEVGPVLNGASPFEGDCATDVVVTAGGDTNVNFLLQPWTGAGTVSGSFMGEGNVPLQNGTVILFPSAGDNCDRLANSRGTFAMPDSYNLSFVPQGTYDVMAQAADAATGTRFFTNGFGDEVTVMPSQDVDFPLVLLEARRLSDPTPVEFARVSGNPTFRWTEPAGVTGATYGIQLFERCDFETSGDPIWEVFDIAGNERAYDGPALQPNTFYVWQLLGSAEGGHRFIFPPDDVEFTFLAE